MSHHAYSLPWERLPYSSLTSYTLPHLPYLKLYISLNKTNTTIPGHFINEGSITIHLLMIPGDLWEERPIVHLPFIPGDVIKHQYYSFYFSRILYRHETLHKATSFLPFHLELQRGRWRCMADVKVTQK